MKPIRLLLLVFCFSAVALHAQQKSYPVDTINGKSYYRYKVEKGIGLYRLSTKFGVSQEMILEANPRVRRTGLQYGTTILIPIVEKEEEVVEVVEVEEIEEIEEVEPVVEVKEMEPVVEQIVVDSSVVVQEVVAIDTVMLVQEEVVNEVPSIAADSDSISIVSVEHDTMWLTDTVRLAIMLPFQAVATKRTVGMERFVEFYMGSLIAIYEAQQSGVYVEVSTYDVGKGVQSIENLMMENWRPVDVIIGPAYPNQVQKVVEYVRKNRTDTWVLVPFISDLKFECKYDKLIQFNPSSKSEAETLAQHLLTLGDDVNCVLMHTRAGEVVPPSVQDLHNALKRYDIPTTYSSISSVLHDSLSRALVPGKENIIIFNTEKYSNLTPVIPYLLKAMNNYQVTLYSRYSWREEEIGIPHIYTSIFIEDVLSPANYKQIYQKYFENKPLSYSPRYDLLGYDLTKQMIEVVLDPTATKIMEVWTGAQSTIGYVKSASHAGYENHQISVIRK